MYIIQALSFSFSVLEYSGPSANYCGEKIYDFGTAKVTAKGFPLFLKQNLDLNNIDPNTTIVYNLIKCDKTFGIVSDQIVKCLKSSVIPRKRFFIDATYSKAFS